MKTNLGLVEHAKMALSEKWGYVWGTFGQVLTDGVLQQKIKQYPKDVGGQEAFIRSNWLNKRAVDCVGLIKSYLWWEDGQVKYNPGQDKSADGMYAAAKEKGKISTIPDVSGLCLWKPGHVGIYIGDGQVIEAKGTKYGVVQTPCEGPGAAGWLQWFKCPYIAYVNNTLDWRQILNKVADDPQRWEIAINGLVLAAESGIVNEFYRHLPKLLEKTYNTSSL